MTATDAPNAWSWLQLLGAAMIGLGWLVAIVTAMATEGPPTSAWLVLIASGISVFASRLKIVRPRLSTTLLFVSAAVAIAAVVASRGLWP